MEGVPVKESPTKTLWGERRGGGTVVAAKLTMECPNASAEK
jgi:hypothetical protein